MEKLVNQEEEDKKEKKEKVKTMDTSKFDSTGKMTKEFMFLGPLGGVGPLPPHITMNELSLFKVEDENILVASWMDDLGNKQQDFDDKLLFYNNEDILNEKSILNHFSKKHRLQFLNQRDHSIEYLCKKGQLNSVNQDNFFCIVDGDIKIMGIFDGHGEQGHIVSNFAMCQMVDYIKNAQILKGKTLFQCYDSISDEEMTKVIECAFKYAQDKLRQWYKDFLIHQKEKPQQQQEMYHSHENVRKPNDIGFDDPEYSEESNARIISQKRDGNDSDVSIDSVDKEFINNISWDTNSREYCNSQSDDSLYDQIEEEQFDIQFYGLKKQYCWDSLPERLIRVPPRSKSEPPISK